VSVIVPVMVASCAAPIAGRSTIATAAIIRPSTLDLAICPSSLRSDELADTRRIRT
jgi:hypothetical protein